MMIDFSMPGPLLVALVLGFFLPIPLWFMTRLSSLRERNPVQFLYAVILTFGVWFLTVAFVPMFAAGGLEDWLVGGMALAGGALVYLEIWGLMSRGYTLSVIAALHEARRPLTPDEIARNYRGGDGLGWIMRHRLGGLEAAGMVTLDDDRVTLQAPGGFFVARLYRLCIQVLGLRSTG